MGEAYVRGAIIYNNDQTFHRELAANKAMVIKFYVRLSTQFVWRVSGIALSDQFRLLYLKWQKQRCMSTQYFGKPLRQAH